MTLLYKQTSLGLQCIKVSVELDSSDVLCVNTQMALLGKGGF